MKIEASKLWRIEEALNERKLKNIRSLRDEEAAIAKHIQNKVVILPRYGANAPRKDTKETEEFQ